MIPYKEIYNYILKIVKQNTVMNTTKEQAIKRLSAIEDETKHLRKIIEQFDNPISIIDRIKTFEDACRDKGINQVDFYRSCSGLTNDEVAYRELKIIISVLNEGWAPDWDNSNENKYYPYFDMRSSTGFGFSYTFCDIWTTTAHVGSRLCFKTRELAEYAGKTFLAQYKNYL